MILLGGGGRHGDAEILGRALGVVMCFGLCGLGGSQQKRDKRSQFSTTPLESLIYGHFPGARKIVKDLGLGECFATPETRIAGGFHRSEERRVGKECRSR